MNFVDNDFNRKLSRCFVIARYGRRKLCSTFIVVAASLWIYFLPKIIFQESYSLVRDFVCVIFEFLALVTMMTLGKFLIKIYHDEIKGYYYSYVSIVNQFPKSLYFSSFGLLPFLIGKCFAFLLVATFCFVKEIPLVGNFCSQCLQVLPIIASFIYCFHNALVIIFMFFLTPIMALKTETISQAFRNFSERFLRFPMQHLLIISIGGVFVTLFFGIVFVVIEKTTVEKSFTFASLFSFHLEIVALSMIMSLPTIFFFNVAAEISSTISKRVHNS